ncbi:hypothetical protein ACF0H5_011905 [Mactra antiquata]
MRTIISLMLLWISIKERSTVNPEDIEECGRQHFAVIRCTSVNFFYRECTVPGAEQVTAIKLHSAYSSYTCEFKESFGYRVNNVWVTNGCSGEFYLCYNGVYVDLSSTERTNTDSNIKPTDGQTPPTTVTGGNIDVVKGSSSATDDNDVMIYVIIASCVVLVVGTGLIIGCVVKRRQQDDKSRHLAAKRQIRIELKEHREHMEENGVATLPLSPASLPMATRSLSVESINYGDSINYNQGGKQDSEREGSIGSSRSSVSGMTSVSAMTTGHMYRSSPSWDGGISRSNLGILKKGLSTSDISKLGRMYCEANTMSRQPKSSLTRHSRSSLARCSQSSLESVREVCNKYQIFNIPLERKLEQQSRRPSPSSTIGYNIDRSTPNARNPKYNTLGHSRGVSEIDPIKKSSQLQSVGRSSLNIKTTKALVHRSPSIKSHNSQSVPSISENVPTPVRVQVVPVRNELQTGNVAILENKPRDTPRDSYKPRDSHYHDPTSLIMHSNKPQVKNVTILPIRSVSPAARASKPEVIYGTINRDKKLKPSILPKPTNTIYATVNKSYFKAASKVSNKSDLPLTSYDVKTLEDDEDDVIMETRDSQYAKLDTFRSASSMLYPSSYIRVTQLSGVTNC